MDPLEKIEEYFHKKLDIQFNPEDEAFFETILKEARKINIDGWQGKDKLNIVKIDTEWNITEHRKDKESGEVAQQTHIIPELDVANLWIMIKNRTPNIGEKTSSRELASDIIFKYHLKIGISEMWGGKNRSKYYFPLLYYCLKILEKKDYIKYGARGDVTRLK